MTENKKHFVATGHTNLEGTLSKEELFNLAEKHNCIHDSYCHKLQLMPKEHCSKDYSKVCGQVKRYYDKYGEAGNHLGVGS